MRSGLIFTFVLTSGIIALSLFLFAGSAASSSPASYRTYAPGDLILSHEDRVFLWEKDVAMVSRECGENMTLLKEGYSFLYDNVDQIYIPASDGTVESKRSANFSLSKNGEIVKQLNVKEGEYFYYNKTIDGDEYTIIKFKVDNIFNADGLCGGYKTKIQPFFQYSDGTVGQEIHFGNSGLSPLEEWNRTFTGLDENTILPVMNRRDNYLNQLFFRSTFIELSVQEIKEGGFILARSYIPTSSNDWLGTPIFLNRIDAEGNELWNTVSERIKEWNRAFLDKYEYIPNIVYKTKNSGTASFISKTKDGGYFLLGVEWEPEGHFELIRTDPQGNELWNRTPGLAVYTDRISSLAQTDDGGCIITSVTREDLGKYYGKYYDSKLIKLDSNGSEQWSRTFGGEYDDHFYSARQTQDGGYIIAGMTESYGHDAWLIKTDQNGDEQWNRIFYAGGGSEALDVRETLDGFILAGRRIAHEGNDALLIKTDQDGNELWMKTFGGKYDDEALFVNQTADGGYILAGTTRSYGSGNKDGWLIKVSGETAVPPGTSTTIPPEKSGGFGDFLAITILLAVYVSGRKRR